MNSEKYKPITERIRTVIKSAGGAQKLADLTNVRKRTIDGYMSGRSVPKMEALIEVCGALDINFLWAATGQGPMKGKEITEVEYSDSVELHEDILIAVIEGAEEWYDENKEHVNMKPSARARVIRALYRISCKNLENNSNIDVEQIKRDVKIALIVHLEVIA